MVGLFHPSNSLPVVERSKLSHAVRNAELLSQLRENLRFEALVDYEEETANRSTTTSTNVKDSSGQVRPLSWVLKDNSGEEFICGYADGSESGMDPQLQQQRKRKVVVKPEDVTVESVLDVLSDLEGLCQTYQKDYWSYEWCHNDEIRQFHVQGGIRTAEWSLGKLDTTSSSLSNQAKKSESSTDGNNGEEEEEHDNFKVISRPKYFSQKFKGGQHCDETNASRSTEVQLSCCPLESR